MTIDEMRERKRELGYTNKDIAERSGLPLGTVQKVFGGATTSPRRETIEAIENVLGPGAFPARISASGWKVRENNLAAQLFDKADVPGVDPDKVQGEYTLDDYYNIPDDYRVELIDGYIYIMETPTTVHQYIPGLIFRDMMNFADETDHNCMPFMAPVDVWLDQDEKTMVQPDLIVVCRDKITIKNIPGAPDFVLEVLSPSTRRKDSIIKLNKYMAAGVREFWIIDPNKETIVVYDFENDNYPINYTFADQVPVLISGGELVIDFAHIAETIHTRFE